MRFRASPARGCGGIQVLTSAAAWAGGTTSREGGPAVFKEFREFAVKGNVVDLAVGVIIGAAFGAIVSSLVADIIMPPLGVLLGNMDFKEFFVLLSAGTPPPPYKDLAAAKAAHA